MTSKEMARCSLFAALLAICAWICIPLPGIVITLQSFAMALALLYLGGKWGCLSILLYLCLGAVGLPVFSGMQGGFGVLLGPTGGFLWGFLLGGLLYWGTVKWCGKVPSMVLAQLICYICGLGWYQIAYGQGSFLALMGTMLLPCLLPDGAKVLLAFYISKKLKH